MFDLDLLIQATKDGLGIAVAAFPFLKEILPKKGDELSQAIEETRRATIELRKPSTLILGKSGTY